MTILPRLFISQPVRFLFCGGFAAAVNWGARIALSQVMSFEMAVVVAYAIGMSVGFALYRTIVWPDHNTSLSDQVKGFLLVNAGSALIVFAATLGLRALLQVLIGPGEIADAGAHGVGIAIGAVANFAGHKAFTFRVRA